MSNYSFCPKCGASLPKGSNFCPGCGINLSSGKSLASTQSAKWTPRHVIGVICLAFALWFPAWMFQDWKAGKKPTQSFEEASAKSSSTQARSDDPEIVRLRKVAESKPDDLSAQQELAATLVDKLREGDTPPQELVFESIEVLTKILKAKPEDPDALIALADITFNQQVFSKSADYYGRYLKIHPEDLNIRARYGSSLAFTGKFDDAIKQLKLILDKDPKNFHANAYLAITYAQMGDSKKALEMGEKALPLAPNDDARARFGQFIDDIKKGPVSTSAKRGNTDDSAPKTAPNAPLGLLSESIANNSVAGPKFISAELGDKGQLKVYFHDFPMQGMPPFVKDKFVNSVKLKAMGVDGTKELVFIDKPSGEVMLTVPLGSN